MTRFTQILSSALLSGVIAFSGATAFAADKVGVVGALNGVVNAKSDAGETRTLNTGAEIFLNDEITTGPKGSAQLMFLDKSALTVSPNSAVIIDTFVYNPANGDGQMALNSAKGALRFIGGALSKKKPVKIKTPVSTIGIRGAIADAHIAPDTGATEAIFIFGKEMSVENMNGDMQVTTEFGTGLSLDTGAALPTPMPQAAVQQRMDNSPVAAAKTVAPSTNTPSPAKQRINNMKSSDTNTAPANEGSNEGDATPAPAPQSNNSAGGNTPATNTADASPVAPDNAAAPQADAPAAGTPPVNAPFAMMEDAAPQMENTSMQQQQDTIRTETETFVETGGSSDNAQGSATTGGFGMAALLNQQAEEGTLNTNNSGFCQRNPEACSRINDVANSDNTPDNETGTLGSDLPPLDDIGTEIVEDEPEVQPVPQVVNPNPAATPTTTFRLFGEYSKNQGGTDYNRALRMRENAAGTHFIGKYREYNNAPDTSDPDVELIKTATQGTVEDYNAAPGLIGSANGSDLKGYAYTSIGGAVHYYDTTNNAGDKFQRFLFGNALLDDSADDFSYADASEAYLDYADAFASTQNNASVLNSGGAGNNTDVMFYSFLPDLSGDRSDFGHFDVGRVGSDTAALGFNIYEGGLSAEGSNTRGVAIDWGTGQFLQNGIKWDTGEAFSTYGRIRLNPALSVTGGRVDQDQNLIAHNNMFEYDGNTAFKAADNLHVDATRVFADDTTGIIDGFVIDADTDNNMAIDNTQVAVQDGNPAQFREVGSATNLQGFAAGFVTTYDGGGSPLHAKGYWNERPVDSANDNYVKINRNAAGNEVGGHFRLLEVNGSVSDGIEAEFGTSNNTGSSGDNTLLGDGLYAAEQHFQEKDYGAFGDTENLYGALIANDGINTDVTTRDYEFVHWGVWAATAQRDHDSDSMTPAEADEVFIPYLAGEVTADTLSNISTDLGVTSVNYLGESLATFKNASGALSHNVGTMNAQIDLANRELTDMQINFGTVNSEDFNLNLAGPAAFNAASNTFSGAALNSAGGATGMANGALFGAQAEEIGGNFNATSNGTEALGIYMGRDINR